MYRVFRVIVMNQSNTVKYKMKLVSMQVRKCRLAEVCLVLVGLKGSEFLDATDFSNLPYFMKAISLEKDPWQFAFII